MRILRICFIFVLFLFLFSFSVFAHLPGQPPYVLIDGRYANLYHVLSTSLSDFALPQDDAPATYVINQPVLFKIDTTRLIAPPVSIPADVVNHSTFVWSFGDGEGDAGLQVSHEYRKPGSYFMNLTVKDASMPSPQLLDIALLQVLPSKEYQLPRAVILLDGSSPKDASSDSILSFDDSHVFDASRSIAGSKRIVSYFWDFGDGTSSTQIKASHVYSQTIREAFPLLRIKDSNGFISDTYITVINKAFNSQVPISSPAGSTSGRMNGFFVGLQLPWVLIGIISICLIFFLLRWLVICLRKKWVL